jgi:hypothetical protein
MNSQTLGLFDMDRVLMSAPVALPISYKRLLIRASAVSMDGLMQIEFDARPLLTKASDEDLQLLTNEMLVGAGPGCHRLLERAGPDGETFLALTAARKLTWGLTLDARRFQEWLAAHRPRLSHLIDPTMCLG